jgi:hypothetical protein
MTLATVCRKALQGISGFNIPSTFYGSANPTASTLVALANEAGQDLEMMDRWTELLTEGTITTVADQATYAKPSDFRAFGTMSQWDRTNQWRLTGPVPSIVWQWLKSGITIASVNNRWFAIRGAYIVIHPTPDASGDTIAYDYYSKNWITKQSDSTSIAEWSHDNDTSKLDENLLAADLKWRFLQAKGFPWEAEYKRYESLKEAVLADNFGAAMIDLGAPVAGVTGFSENIPDSGYGE